MLQNPTIIKPFKRKKSTDLYKKKPIKEAKTEIRVYRGERVSRDESSSHSERRQIRATTTKVNQVKQEENNKCEANWNRKDKCLIKFNLRRVRCS